MRRILTGSEYPKGSHPEGQAFVKAQEPGSTEMTAPIAAANNNTTIDWEHWLWARPCARAFCVRSHLILTTNCHISFTHGVTEAQGG